MTSINLGEMIRRFALGPVSHLEFRQADAANIHASVFQILLDDELADGSRKYGDAARDSFPYQEGLEDAKRQTLNDWHDQFFTWFIFSVSESERETLRKEVVFFPDNFTPKVLRAEAQVGGAA